MPDSSPKFEICRYYNDHKSAVSLMIDDLAPNAITTDGKVMPFNDHGYSQRQPKGLYDYFEKEFLNKFPEAKGTFFIITDKYYSHSRGLDNNYTIISSGYSKEYIDFLHSLKPEFDFGFHGIHHNIDVKGHVFHEFEVFKRKDVGWIYNNIKAFQNNTGILFTGGKFPGYKSNEVSESIIEELGFKWWAFNNDMKNKKNKKNNFCYRGTKDSILEIPTNFSGDSFKTFLKTDRKPFLFKLAYQPYLKIKLENHLEWLYSNNYPITIQEHFTTAKINGKFQRPNVFDDLDSLIGIYSILRGADLWHTTCNQLAQYIENRDRTEIRVGNGNVELSYHGVYSNPSVSVASNKCNKLKNKNGAIIEGVLRNNHWVFSKLKPGSYSWL